MRERRALRRAYAQSPVQAGEAPGQKRGMYERWAAHLDTTYSAMDRRERQSTAERRALTASLTQGQRAFGSLMENGNFNGLTGQVEPPWRR